MSHFMELNRLNGELIIKSEKIRILQKKFIHR